VVVFADSRRTPAIIRRLIKIDEQFSENPQSSVQVTNQVGCFGLI